MGRKKGYHPEDKDQEFAVHLKPIFGIRPGVYLTVLYSFILALALFLVLVLPGIVRNGTRVSFHTYPAGAEIVVDDGYSGSTPCTVFLRKGEHRVTILKAHYEPQEFDLLAGGKIFFSLFSPRKEDIHRRVILADPKALAEEAISEAARWSMALPQGANYQAPLTASESVPELAAQGALSADDLAALLVNLLAYAATDRALADLASAGFSAAGTGNPVSPLSYLSAVRYFIQLQEDYKAVPFLLEDLLDTTLSDSPFDRDELARYLKTIPAATGESGIEPNNPGAPPRIDLAGVTFLPVSGGSLERAFTTRESGKRAFTVMIPAFSMSDREITNGMYARFLSENPYWSAENRTELVSKGLVTDEYLKMFSETADKDEPVTYISWYAAAAFCEWLNSQLAGPPAGFVVRLPYEEEFERAASLYDEAEPVFGRKNGPLGITGRKAVIGGIHDLRGNVWEWTGSWFSPYADYLIDFSEENAMGMPEGLLESFAQDGFPPPAEGIVKGGSWANTAKEITANTRGSQPAAWCTPFLGFRPVISRIQ